MRICLTILENRKKRKLAHQRVTFGGRFGLPEMLESLLFCKFLQDKMAVLVLLYIILNSKHKTDKLLST